MAIVKTWRMGTQTFFIDAQPPSYFVHPSLILGDAGQLIALVDIRAAVAHASDENFGAALEGGDQCRPHAFEVGVVGGGVHYPAVGFLERLRKPVGIALAGFGDKRRHCLHRQLGGLLAGLRAAHSVGDDIQTRLRRQQVRVLIVLTDTPGIG
jgi:hypothetical protein